MDHYLLVVLQLYLKVYNIQHKSILEVCEKYKSQFYTTPTAIRSLMASGDEPVLKHDLSSLRILGTVGEPINQA